MTHTYIHKSSFLYFIDNKIYVLLSLLVCALPLSLLSFSPSLSLSRSSSHSVSPSRAACAAHGGVGGYDMCALVCDLARGGLPGEDLARGDHMYILCQ